jgi:hypothetical protein
VFGKLTSTAVCLLLCSCMSATRRVEDLDRRIDLVRTEISTAQSEGADTTGLEREVGVLLLERRLARDREREGHQASERWLTLVLGAMGMVGQVVTRVGVKSATGGVLQ